MNTDARASRADDATPPPGGPLVSVVLTTYNQGAWINEAVDSVVGQTYPHWELIVVDNGSTDDTPERLARYAGDPRIELVRHPVNRFHTAISNEAFRRTRGKYVALLYGDDYFLPEKLARQVARFEALGDDYGAVVCNGYRKVQATGEMIADVTPKRRGDVFGHLLALGTTNKMFLPVAPVLRREALLRYPYDERLFMEGETLHLRVAMRYKFDHVDDLLFVMRTTETNMGREIDTALERNLAIYDRLAEHPDFPPALRPMVPKLKARIYRDKGWQAIRVQRRYRQGRSWVVEGLRNDPRELANVRTVLALAIGSMPDRHADRAIAALDRIFGVPPSPPPQTYGA